MPDQQAVQTTDGQFPTFPQSAVQEQPMEVTQLVRFQGVPISDSNEGIEQIHDQIPGHAVQTTDSQLQTTFEELEQQQQPMETLPNQVLSQHDLQSSPKNTSIEGSLSEILVTPGTSGVKSSLATQTPDDQLQATSAEPEQQQQPIEVTQLETKLKIHSGVLYDDGRDDYIKEDNIDGVDLIPLDDDFATKKSFEKHVASVHEEKKNKCSECDASFSFKMSLIRHVASVHGGKKNKCSKCDASFRRKKSLKKHIASDHEEKKPGKKIEGKGKKVKVLRFPILTELPTFS